MTSVALLFIIPTSPPTFANPPAPPVPLACVQEFILKFRVQAALQALAHGPSASQHLLLYQRKSLESALDVRAVDYLVLKRLH